MFIKLPDNLHFGQLQVLAVNLNAFQRVAIYEINNLFNLTLDLSLPIDSSDNPIENDPAKTIALLGTYKTREEALKVFEDMMKALKNGCLFWSPEKS